MSKGEARNRLGTLRITSGRLRGRKIVTPAGADTRPLLTRLRKSLADILRPILRGARVLDLFAGSGAVAFELVSNGAAEAVLVEIDPRTARLIEENAKNLGLQASVEVRVADAVDFVRQLSQNGESFHVIVVAPPYGHDLHKASLDALEKHPLLAPNGVAVIQREVREALARTTGRLRHVRSRKYGRTVFDFYRVADSAELSSAQGEQTC